MHLCAINNQGMALHVQVTSDNSSTIFSDVFKETYHSVNGAETESRHVFIDAGLSLVVKSTSKMRIFEMGFGTGLNALLTLLEADKIKLEVEYHALELFPLDEDIYRKLDFSGLAGFRPELLERLHAAEWEVNVAISPQFVLKKTKADLVSYSFTQAYDLVYFDAFSPVTQPHLWSDAVFEKIYASMLPGAVLTTYCAKGEVRRTMQRAGFKVERLAGPPGKREMLRALK